MSEEKFPSQDVVESLNGSLDKNAGAELPHAINPMGDRIESGDGAFFSWKVKPKFSFASVLQGDIAGAVKKTSLSVEFGKEFKDQDVTVTVSVNGNAALVLNSPKDNGKFSASFCAEKRF